MSKKLFYDDHRFYGQVMTVPVDQNVLIDEEGFVEVSETCAEVLLGIPNWKDPTAKQEEDLDEITETKAKGKNKNKTPLKPNLDWLEGVDLDELEKLSVDELTEIAVAGDIKNYDKFLKNQVAMAKYIKSQLNKLKK